MKTISAGELTVLLNEETLSVTVRCKQAKWSTLDGFIPVLQCKEGTFPFTSAASVSHELFKTGVGTGIRSTFSGFCGTPYTFETQKERSWCDLGTALEYNECRQTAKNCLKFLFWRHSIMYFDAIAKIVSERTGCDVSAVKPESKFSELGIDSLDTVELLMNLEDEIGIEIELDQKVETIDDLDKFIQSKQG